MSPSFRHHRPILSWLFPSANAREDRDLARRGDRRLPTFGFLVALLLASVGWAQPVLDVTDLTSSAFSTLEAPDGSVFSDPLADHQTGQATDDMVGDATLPGFFIGYGLLDGAEAFAFRFRLDDVGNKTEFTGNIRVGVAIDNDDSVDVFLGPKLSGNAASQGITFQEATGTAPDSNTSPSTTSIGNAQQTIAFRTTGSDINYDYQVAPETAANSFNGDVDAILTFALTFTELNNALDVVLGTGTEFDIASDSLMRFIAYTATQPNSINQDLYGSDGITGTTTFATSGFTNFTDLTGTPIPEPGTWAMMGALLFAPLLLKLRSRRTGRRG